MSLLTNALTVGGQDEFTLGELKDTVLAYAKGEVPEVVTVLSKEDMEKYFKTSENFYPAVEKIIKTKKEDYDCLLLFSGGKDSSYALYRLVEMGWKVLTFTFDNGFISDVAFSNIERITSKLGVENIICTMDNINQVFVSFARFRQYT